jgi:hypothetical protein
MASHDAAAKRFQLVRTPVDGQNRTRNDPAAGEARLPREDGFVVLAVRPRAHPNKHVSAGYLARRDQLVADDKLTDRPSPEFYTPLPRSLLKAHALRFHCRRRNANGPRE